MISTPAACSLAHMWMRTALPELEPEVPLDGVRVRTGMIYAALPGYRLLTLDLYLPEALVAASPITYLSGDDPPALLLHGSEDRFVPTAQTLAMAEKMRAAGGPVEAVYLDAGRSVTSPFEASRLRVRSWGEAFGGGNGTAVQPSLYPGLGTFGTGRSTLMMPVRDPSAFLRSRTGLPCQHAHCAL